MSATEFALHFNTFSFDDFDYLCDLTANTESCDEIQFFDDTWHLRVEVFDFKRFELIVDPFEILHNVLEILVNKVFNRLG